MKKKRAHYFKRYRQIASVLSRHGLGWLSLQLGIGKFIPFHWGLLGHPKRVEPYVQAEHMRMALEDLGATFIKLGQILSTRPDLLPPEYIAEFSKLQEHAPEIPYDMVADVIKKELGAPPHEIFKTFDTRPRASASIGQVHAGSLHDDTPVVVKVQRPGVEKAVEDDIGVLSDLARYAARHTEMGSYYDLEEWVEEFAFTLRNEMNYILEGQNAEHIRNNFAGDERLYVPRIYWEYSAVRVLTMEDISGIKITDLKSLDGEGLDRRRIIENCAHIILTMCYDHGFFHADPHPGNYFVLPGEVIGLIDYGMVGRLDENQQRSLLRMDIALIRKDTERLADEFLMLGASGKMINRKALKRDFDRLIQLYYDKPLKEIAASQAFSGFIDVARRHRLQLPGDLIILFKTIAMCEGIGVQLSPEFRLMEFAEPYFKRFWRKSYSLGKQIKRIAEGAQEFYEMSMSLPRQARRILWQMDKGMVLTTRLEGLEEARREMRQAANRISESVLTAALIVGLGLLMLIYHPPGWQEYGRWVFGLLFSAVVLFGMILLWKIWRSGRKE